MPPKNSFSFSQPPKKSHGALLVLLGLTAGLLIAGANRQAIMDWAALRGYSAPDVIASIATEDTMTPTARKIFYVNHPVIANKSGFGKDCSSGKSREKTIILGCYHGNQGGIFVLEVDDPRLTGVEQVTAAHEMLHAAYDRLSGGDKEQVNAMLNEYYQHQLMDDRIKTTIDAYRQSEPDDVINEMHSIFGSEISNLPAPLETYYKRYFTDRTKVAGFANRYQAEFSSRTAAVKQYDAQLADLKAHIDAINAQLKQSYEDIAAEQGRLAALRSSGNIAQYNASVPAYNRKVDSYNSQVGAVQILVDQYNELVAQRNAIAIEQQQLANALSSSATPIK